MKNEDVYIKNARGKEIDIKEYFEVIKSRIWVIILITMLTTLAGYFYQKFYNNYVPLYKTSTRIIINANNEYMKTLMVMIKDPTVMEKVKENLHLDSSPESIADQIEVSRVDNSTVISISVTDTSPTLAVSIANETANVFKNEIVNILNFKNVQLLSPAKEIPFPINQPQNKIVIVMLALGIVIGVALVFLLDSLDGTVKRESEVESNLGVPVIGIVSNMNKKKLLGEKKKYKSLKFRGEAVDL